MGFSWQRVLGAFVFALFPTFAMFGREIFAGALDVPLMLFVLLLVFLVAYRAWPSLYFGRRRPE